MYKMLSKPASQSLSWDKHEARADRSISLLPTLGSYACFQLRVVVFLLSSYEKTYWSFSPFVTRKEPPNRELLEC